MYVQLFCCWCCIQVTEDLCVGIRGFLLVSVVYFENITAEPRKTYFNLHCLCIKNLHCLFYVVMLELYVG